GTRGDCAKALGIAVLDDIAPSSTAKTAVPRASKDRSTRAISSFSRAGLPRVKTAHSVARGGHEEHDPERGSPRYAPCHASYAVPCGRVARRRAGRISERGRSLGSLHVRGAAPAVRAHHGRRGTRRGRRSRGDGGGAPRPVRAARPRRTARAPWRRFG